MRQEYEPSLARYSLVDPSGDPIDRHHAFANFRALEHAKIDRTNVDRLSSRAARVKAPLQTQLRAWGNEIVRIGEVFQDDAGIESYEKRLVALKFEIKILIREGVDLAMRKCMASDLMAARRQIATLMSRDQTSVGLLRVTKSTRDVKRTVDPVRVQNIGALRVGGTPARRRK